MLNNKKGEIGESITWVVATVIIIVVLTIFIIASNILGGFSKVSVSSGERTLNAGSYLDIKTNLALRENFDNIKTIKDWTGITEKEEDAYDTSMLVGG